MAGRSCLAVLAFGQFVFPFFALVVEKIRRRQELAVGPVRADAVDALRRGRVARAAAARSPSSPDDWRDAGGGVSIRRRGAVVDVRRSAFGQDGERSSPLGGFAPKQDQNEQAERDDRERGGSGQDAPDRRGIDALCRIEAVTHQPDMILPCSDPAFAGVDQRQPQIGRIERKAREDAGDTAARRHHKGRRGMGELVVLAVIDRSKSKDPGQFRNVLR